MSVEAGIIVPGSSLSRASLRVEQSPQYRRIEQLPSLCGPASLQMVFNRRGSEADQLQIAQSLGTKVPESRREEFAALLPIADDPAKAGTDLDVFVSKKMKRVANRFGVPLEASLYHMEQIPDLSSFLKNNIEDGNDVLVNFIDNLNKAQTGLGHYALVSAVEGQTVELCDPWPGNDAFYPVHAEALSKGINTIDALENRRGIVVFKGQITHAPLVA